MEAAAKIDPVSRRLEPGQRLDLDGRMADDIEQLLVAPDVRLERGLGENVSLSQIC